MLNTTMILLILSFDGSTIAEYRSPPMTIDRCQEQKLLWEDGLKQSNHLSNGETVVINCVKEFK